MERIFVQIASYRDTECKHTIEDLFRRASAPERIFVGLNWQYADEDADYPFFQDRDYADRIRVIRNSYSEAKGVCWARSVAQSLYRGEDFLFQIDAHMRFEQDWDITLIDMHRELCERGHPKPVLTLYPPGYFLDRDEREQELKKAVPYAIDGIVIFRRTQHTVPVDGRPFVTPCLAAGFLFASGKCIEEIPYDPFLYFFGEEMSLAVRFWTHGWETFNPGKIVAYHLYARHIDKESGEVRRIREGNRHGRENPSAQLLSAKARARFRHLLQIELSCDQEVTQDIAQYGLGTVRTLHQYEQFSGFSFKSLRVRPYCRTGYHFTERISPVLDAREDILRVAETRLRITDISNAARLVGARTILDVGAAANGEDIVIHGISMSFDRIRNLRMDRRGEKNRLFSQYDMLAEPLPRCDAAMCHDLPQILPAPMVWQLLESIKASGAKLLMVLRNPKLHTPDLESAPFHFPAPLCLMPCADETTLVIWNLQTPTLHIHGMPEPLALLRKQLLGELETALRIIEAALRGSPGIYRELVNAYVQTSGGAARALLEMPSMRHAMTHSSVKQAMDLVGALRWRTSNAALSRCCPAIDEHSVFAMALTCEVLEDLRDRIDAEASDQSLLSV